MLLRNRMFSGPTSYGSPDLTVLLVAVGLLSLPGASHAQEDLEPPVKTPWEAIELLDASIEPGTKKTLYLRSSESFSGDHVETPVIVIHGTKPGPMLCLIAGIHGDEVNGVEIVRRVMVGEERLEGLAGTLLAVPIANISAFRRSSRFLPDRRDLNRYFPGRIDGSSASRIAYRIFDGVIRHCDALLDLHTGSFHRTNLHQVRADLTDLETSRLALAYHADAIINKPGGVGTLRRAALQHGIPAITIEAGEPARFDEDLVEESVRAIEGLIATLEMSEPARSWLPRSAPKMYLQTSWVRCNNGGILVSRVELGDEVEEGELLGTISDPVSDEIAQIRAPFSGRVIGMALDQLVMPGFAAYHLASESPQPHVSTEPPGVGELFDDPEGVDLEERPE